jgi:hypothetical protein
MALIAKREGAVSMDEFAKAAHVSPQAVGIDFRTVACACNPIGPAANFQYPACCYTLSTGHGESRMIA